jgi:hypothetical protein
LFHSRSLAYNLVFLSGPAPPSNEFNEVSESKGAGMWTPWGKNAQWTKLCSWTFC